MEKQEVQDTIRHIKSELRVSMNGIASTYMRENGMDYKLNFGVEIPRLKMIAQEFPCDHQLAQALWKENIRECKILASMLQPISSFYPEIADIWMESIPNAEIAQHTVMNLFCKLPYASEKAFQWIADEREMPQICGYLILARLFMQGKEPNEEAENEFLDQTESAINGSAEVRRAAYSALLKYQELNEQAYLKGKHILDKFTNRNK